MKDFLNSLKKKKKPLGFLFLCSGNICRSPMAEMLFEKMAKEKGIQDQIISTSGAVHFHNNSIMWETSRILRDEGVADERIRKFFPRHIDVHPELLEADIILTMDKSHLRRIPQKYQSKSFLLSIFAGEPAVNIEDPYGGNIDSYRIIANEIKFYLDKILNNLIENNIFD
ncbi:MAG: hypothetical protein GF329_17990 [Candidatus Lokiarchaeota archaeon]|nr:hypothetical protein [Candidatus Lokiarchaeota archaeon]